MDAGEDPCERSFLLLACDDLLGVGERIECTLVGEDAVFGRRFGEEVVVLSHEVCSSPPFSGTTSV